MRNLRPDCVNFSRSFSWIASWIAIRLLVIGAVILLNSNVHADIVSTSLDGFVLAEINGVNEFDDSFANSASISANVTGPPDITTSAMSWSWGSDTLSGSQLITMNDTSESSGDHYAYTYLSFEFEVNTLSDYDMSGSWGNISTSGSEDFLAYELSGPSGILAFNGSSLSGLGLNSESFTESGTLSPGIYTLIFEAEVFETIDRAGPRQVGWTLDEFHLTSSPIPEPASGGFISLAVIILATRRRRRKTDETSLTVAGTR